MVDLVTVVPFNDLAAVERALVAHRGEVAGMILEPLMMNAGVIHPEPGYLAGLKELLHAHDALLTFDEVKTGLTVGPGGVTGAQGVTPDIVCIAKAIGGGVSAAAIGGTEELMGLIADGTYEQVGTFNGNPLAMAATRAMLTEVMTDAAYAHIERLAAALAPGSRTSSSGTTCRGTSLRQRREGVHRVPARTDPQLPRLPRHRRPARQRPLAGAAQRRRVPAAMGQDRAVVDLRPAHRR